MSDTKFTPGPWQVSGNAVKAIAQVAYCGASGSWSNKGTQVIGDDEAKANAILIAAAPDLYAALKMMTDRFLDANGSYGEYENETIDAANSALEKARGE